MENIEILPNNENVWPRALHFSSEMLPRGSCSWYALCPCPSLWADIPGLPTSLMMQHRPLSCRDNAMHHGSHITMVLCEKHGSHGKPSHKSRMGSQSSSVTGSGRHCPKISQLNPHASCHTLKPCWEAGCNLTQRNFSLIERQIFHWKKKYSNGKFLVVPEEFFSNLLCVAVYQFNLTFVGLLLCCLCLISDNRGRAPFQTNVRPGEADIHY